MVLTRRSILTIFLAVLLGLTACSPEGLSSLNLPDSAGSLPVPTPQPSPVPQQVLSICLGQEPRSLFLYGDQSASARIIRQAVYDGPLDRIGEETILILLDEVPSQENGLVTTSAVEVFPGERIVDARGNLTVLGEGVEFRPAGCTAEDCWETYGNQDSVILDQVQIIYNLKAGVLWSDGTPVTPEDSLFSYQTAGLIYGAFGPSQLRYTASYEPGEDLGLIWKGLPGYLGIYDYTDYFYSPLPVARWSNFSREEFLTAPQSNIQPLGWGAYRIQEWIPGDHITLLPNPYYWAVDQELPKFDALVFRFVDGAEEALAAYSAGECQIIANESELMTYQSELLARQRDGELTIINIEGQAWEQISFGISSLPSKVNPLQDPALRSALAGCIDREGIAGSRLDAGLVVDGYDLPWVSVTEEEDQAIIYQPAESGLALKELGWVDLDGDPETPRTAQGVEGIPDGTPLQFELLAADADQRTLTLDYIQEGLGACGVGLDVLTLPSSQLLEPGPDGPVFGRNFDLAYFAWKTGHYQPCKLFMSAEIPGLFPAFSKGWGGVNASGFSDESFDEACLTALTTLPDSESRAEAEGTAREIFLNQLPALPLFFRQELIIAHPDILGLESGPGAPFWSIEVLE